jgi:N-acetyl-anhydromuramyl-L-alanine amidase AmpD
LPHHTARTFSFKARAPAGDETNPRVNRHFRRARGHFIPDETDGQVLGSIFMKGSEFAALVANFNGEDPRYDAAIKDAIDQDSYVLSFCPLDLGTVAGHTAQVLVSSDGFAIGEPDDFVRVPMTLVLQQEIADKLGLALVTPKISDLAWQQAAFKIEPIPFPDVVNTTKQLSPSTAMRHNARVAEALAAKGYVFSEDAPVLVRGMGKEIVLTNLLTMHPDRVAIFGWHHLDGHPIQPLSTIHEWRYWDYSHMATFLAGQMLLDGVWVPVADVLQSPLHARLLSYEGVTIARVPTPPAKKPSQAPPPSVGSPGALLADAVLRQGMHGEAVTRLQAWLVALGYEVTVDGDFGSGTAAALVAFQSTHGLTADGIAGPATYAKIRVLVRDPVVKPTPPRARGDFEDVALVQARHFTAMATREIDLIVVHDEEYPEKPTASEEVAASFAAPNAREASAHFCFDNDSEVQCVLLKDRAWAAQGLNERGVHFEHAGYAKQSDADWHDAYSSATLARSQKRAAVICKAHGIPPVFVTGEQLAEAFKRGERIKGITTHFQGTRAGQILKTEGIDSPYAKSDHTDPGDHFPTAEYVGGVAALVAT